MHYRPIARALVLGCALSVLAAPAVEAAPGRLGTVTYGAGRTGVVAASANARISQVLAERSNSAVLGSGFTMTVRDPSDDQYVFSRRASASLRGASTTKILTTVAALETLGPDHRMPTRVLQTATREIVLKAGGDPMLSSANLRELARGTARALTSAPASPASTPPSSTPPSSTPATESTQPSVASSSASPTPAGSSLTTASPTAGGSTPPAEQIPPAVPGPTASPQVTGTSYLPASVGAADTRATPRSLGRVVVRADDSLFPGSGQSVGWPNYFLPGQVRPVNAFARDDNRARDAAADAGRYFTAALRSAGIQATYAGEASAPPDAPTIASFAGHTIGQAVSRALLISDNDTAEMLFRQVAVGRGTRADWAGARRAQRAALADLGIPLEGVEIVDGSGLSTRGRLTAGALTTALAKSLTDQHPRLAKLRSWLPVAGRTGTLKASSGRFNTQPARCAAGLIQAKTGTLSDAIALAGFARGADGNTKIFVAIVNSRPTRYSRATTRRYLDRVAASVTGCW